MIYFCADDYGIGESCNERIEACLKDGILNIRAAFKPLETYNESKICRLQRRET